MMDISKKYVITGGSGFLGDELIKRLIKRGFSNLVVIGRNEGKLIELKEKYRSIEIVPGDISDSFLLEKTCKDVAGIFHLAAFKFVGLAETETRACVVSNVLGTLNLLEATRRYKPEFILGVSTDKAINVKGVYGATKLLQERLFKEYEGLNPDTKYRTVRYGNVIYSTGSVLCKWRDKLRNGDEVIITNPDATRFYWTVEQAVDLIFQCLENATDSTPSVTSMKSIRIGDLLEAMKQKYLPQGKELKVKTIGLQEGENMHERIVENGPDSSQVEKFTVDEILYLI